MLKRLGQRPEKKETKTRQLWGTEFSVVKNGAKTGLDEEQVTRFVDSLIKEHQVSHQASLASLRSLLEKAVTELEQIIAFIEMKTPTGAAEEATRITHQAKQVAEEIRRSGDLPAPKKGAATQVASTGKGAIVSEPVVATAVKDAEPRPTEEMGGAAETELGLAKEESEALYTGPVELALAKSLDVKIISKLYNYLQTTPEIKLLQTSGSRDRGTTITVVLDRPIRLMSALQSRIPEAEITPERPGQDDLEKGKAKLLLDKGGKDIRRIKLTVKGVPHP